MSSKISWRERYLTVKEAGEIAGMTAKALYNRISRGVGPRTTNVGRSVRIFGGDLVHWIHGAGEAKEESGGQPKP